MLLWIYIYVLFILCSYCITSSSNFVMLRNVNLNTLTLCLSICNRMAPPTQHQLYPLLEVEYDDPHRAHFLTDTDVEVPLPPLRPHTNVGYTPTVLPTNPKRQMRARDPYTPVTYLVMSNEYCHPKLANVMWQLVNLRTDSIYFLHIYFNVSRQHL